MAYDPKNCFIISANKKGDNPRRPDYRGTVTIEGVDYELAGWIKKKKDGSGQFVSGSVKPKVAKPTPAPESGSFDADSAPNPTPAPHSAPPVDEEDAF